MDRPRAAVIDQIELLGMVQSFVPSAVFFALVRLDVFRVIGSHRLDSSAIATAVEAPEARLRRLLDAGVMLGLLQSDDDEQFSVSSSLQGIIVDENDPRFLGNWLRFMAGWYEPFGHLDQIAMAEKGSSMYAPDSTTLRSDTLAMHNFASSRGREVVEFLDLTNTRTFLDVGCGPGTYAFEFGRRYPQLTLALLDSPGVLSIAQEVANVYGLQNGIVNVPLDLSTDRICGEYDTVFASNVLQAFDPARAREIVSNLYDVVSKGGSLVIQAQFLAAGRQGPRWPTFVDLACMVFTELGQNHTVAEAMEWMEDAGFTDLYYQPMSLLNTNGFVRGFKQ